MKISLLNPFTPKAAGVVETKVAEYHNQPHLSAFRALVDKGHDSSIEYPLAASVPQTAEPKKKK